MKNTGVGGSVHPEVLFTQNQVIFIYVHLNTSQSEF